MQLFPFAAALCAAATSLVVLGAGTTVRGQTPSLPAANPSTAAPLPKPRTWLVDNQNRLVTVKEKDGSPLFAQVITTPNVIVQVNADAVTKKITLTLKDANGKTLYKMPFPIVKQGSFNFSFTADENQETHVKTGGTSFTLTPSAANGDSSEDRAGGKMVFVIGPDDWIASGDVTFDNNHIVLARHDSRITMTNYADGKKTGDQIFELDIKKGTGKILSDGKEVGSFQTANEAGPFVIRDVKGEISYKAVKRDDKDYTELTLGERKILLEGGNWSFESKNGDVFIKNTAETTPPVATTTANK